MAWIESHESLPNHPKTKRMCRMLKITPVQAVGHLHFFWWWAMSHAQDGSLDRYNADDIADACSWEGDPNDYFNALVTAGFIDKTPSGHSIHDWYVYAGKLIALRQKDAERKRISRGKKQESAGSPTDIQRTSDGSLTESIRNPNPNLNHNTQEEEKGPQTALDAYIYSFKKIMYTGHIQAYVTELLNRGFTDAFIREVFLEMGARGVGPDERYMRKLAEDWIANGIYTRAEAERRKQKKLRAVPDKHTKIDPELEARRREIALNKWISEGNDPDEFVYRPASGD